MTSSIVRTRRADSGLERGEARSPVLGIREALQVCTKGESVTPGLGLEPITQLVADLDRRRHTLSMPTPTELRLGRLPESADERCTHCTCKDDESGCDGSPLQGDSPSANPALPPRNHRQRDHAYQSDDVRGEEENRQGDVLRKSLPDLLGEVGCGLQVPDDEQDPHQRQERCRKKSRPRPPIPIREECTK